MVATKSWATPVKGDLKGSGPSGPQISGISIPDQNPPAKVQIGELVEG